MAGRSGVGKRRREQIIEAAVAIIAEQGLQHLSLSAIEEKAGMSRGQLTYYFPAKEDILLAVFERMIATMHLRFVEVLQQRGEYRAEETGCPFALEGWRRISAFLAIMLLHPPELAEFHSLQYTFLSQIGHREDFRARLASLFEEWRSHMADDFVRDLPEGKASVSPRTLAAFVQALLHGLAIQRAVDSGAYDCQEMLTLCSELLGNYLDKPAQAPVSPPQTTHRG
jgi:AcrR family transcriptional regulator